MIMEETEGPRNVSCPPKNKEPLGEAVAELKGWINPGPNQPTVPEMKSHATDGFSAGAEDGFGLIFLAGSS